MKAVKAHLLEKNPDRVPAFEKGAATFAKKVLSNFGDYEFYTGEVSRREQSICASLRS